MLHLVVRGNVLTDTDTLFAAIGLTLAGAAGSSQLFSP